MTNKERDILFEQIYQGIISIDNLPESLYVEYATAFNISLFEGYGKKLSKLVPDSYEYQLLTGMKDNLNLFSGCKTFHQIKQSQELILNPDGSLKAFNTYLKEVESLDAVYRDYWLETERRTAVRQAQQARQWQEIQEDKEILPLLQYDAIIDAVTRDDHAAFNGITLPANDPFWNTNYPPNGYNCRCMVIQLEEGKVTKKFSKEQKEAIKDVDPMFRMNAGKDGYIFKNEGKGVHPYFKLPEAYEVKRDNNFGFPKI